MGCIYRGIRDINWVTYLGGVYSGGVLTGFYGISISLTKKVCKVLSNIFEVEDTPFSKSISVRLAYLFFFSKIQV